MLKKILDHLNKEKIKEETGETQDKSKVRQWKANLRTEIGTRPRYMEN